jgi:Meckel syndrome type 1 protein
MTRPPQLPPLPPPEPLDESERALARALRNLPSSAPPPELDARILGAARRSVHMQTPRHRDRRWIVGLSTAATAVLAMGILLKMHGLGRDAVLTPPAETEPAAETVTAPSNAPAATSEVMKDKKDVSSRAADAMAPAGITSPAPAAIPAQPQDESGRFRQEQSANSAGQAQAAKQAARAFPAEIPPLRSLRPPPPPPPPVIMEEPSPMAVQAPAPASPSPPAAVERKESDATESGYARRDAAALSAPAPASAAGGMLGPTEQDQAKASKSTANAMQSNEPVPQQHALDKVGVTGGRLKAANPALPALSDDAKLDADDWIARIRERLNHGDRTGATSSLKSFVRAHPDVAIPDDLQPLLH